MKLMSPRPIFIYLKIPLEVLLGKMTDLNRQYSSQVFTFEESIQVLFSPANFSLNFNFLVFSSLDMCLVSSPSKAYTSKAVIVDEKKPFDRWRRIGNSGGRLWPNASQPAE